MNRSRQLRLLGRCMLALAVVALAAWLARRSLAGMSLGELGAALAATDPWRLACSLGLTALSFAGLARFEALATEWVVPGRVPRRDAWRTGLVAHAVSNTLGFHVLTAAAIRMRAYARHGLRLAEVARVMAGVATGVAVGVAAVGVLAVLAWQSSAGGRERALSLGLAVLAAALFALRVRAWRRAPGEWRSHPGRQAVRLVATGLVETTAAMGALYVLLPPDAITPAGFALAFLGAMLLGLASHVPGGVGVFEAAMITALGRMPVAQALAALLTYRVVYNLLPCALAALAVAWRGGIARRAGPSSTADSAPAGGAGAGTGGPA